jgi:hypothetical protein
MNKCSHLILFLFDFFLENFSGVDHRKLNWNQVSGRQVVDEIVSHQFFQSLLFSRPIKLLIETFQIDFWPFQPTSSAASVTPTSPSESSSPPNRSVRSHSVRKD